MVDVAYVPLSADNPQTKTDSINIIPPYEDSGVRFQGYSKTLIKQGEYRLNLQERHIVQLTGTIGGGSLVEAIPSDKNFYCDKINVSVAYTGGALLLVNIFDSGDFKFTVSTVDSHVNIDFVTPIKFENNVLFTFLGLTAADVINCNAFGWFESKFS